MSPCVEIMEISQKKNFKVKAGSFPGGNHSTTIYPQKLPVIFINLSQTVSYNFSEKIRFALQQFLTAYHGTVTQSKPRNDWLSVVPLLIRG